MVKIVLLIFTLTLAFSYSPTPPEQLRISWADEVDSMFVTWGSEFPDQTAIVRWTPVSHNKFTLTDIEYQFSTPGTWRFFHNMPDDTDSRGIYVAWAKLTSLKPGQFYQYQVGSDAVGWSNSYIFKARREFTDENPPKFLLYGDFGTGPEIQEVLTQLIEEVQTYEHDAILHVGDVAYELNTDEGRNGDLFFRQTEPLGATTPYMLTQGNHEGPHHKTTEHYMNRFTMPGDAFNFWYSFNAGKAHFLVFSTEFAIYPQESVYPWNDMIERQMEFIENDLRQVNREETPWLITMGHRPFYCSPDWTLSAAHYDQDIPWERHNKDCIESGPRVKGAYENLFYRNGVDMLLFAHVHAYERMAPVYNNKTVTSEYDTNNMHVNPRAPVQIITGIPGNQESYAPISPTPAEYSRGQTSEKGYGRLVVYNSTHLYYEQIIAETKEVTDYVWVIKDNKRRSHYF